MYLLFYDSSGCWGVCVLQVADTDNRQGKCVAMGEDHVLLNFLKVKDQLLWGFVSEVSVGGKLFLLTFL